MNKAVANILPVRPNHWCQVTAEPQPPIYVPRSASIASPSVSIGTGEPLHNSLLSYGNKRALQSTTEKARRVAKVADWLVADEAAKPKDRQR